MENSFSASPGAPPPLIPPPPVITPPPPAKPRKSWGWMIVSVILIVLLGFSWLIIIAQGVSHSIGNSFSRGLKNSTAREVGPKLDEYILKDNDAHDKIAVITVDGIISSGTDPAGNNMVDVIQAELNRAKDDKRVKAVILKVDSPGGEVMASDEINKVIVKFQDDSKKPVICSM